VKTVRILLWLPVVGFVIVLGLVASGLLRPHDTTIRSRMVGQKLPAFSLPSVQGNAPPLTPVAFADGTPRLVNFFASWCVPCAAEAPELMQLKQAGVPIVGVAVRDLPADTLGFLRRNGNPYSRLVRDDAATMQIALGSSGVPETFVIDGKGVIRAQHIGQILPEEVPALVAQVRALR